MDPGGEPPRRQRLLQPATPEFPTAEQRIGAQDDGEDADSDQKRFLEERHWKKNQPERRSGDGWQVKRTPALEGDDRLPEQSERQWRRSEPQPRRDPERNDRAHGMQDGSDKADGCRHGQEPQQHALSPLAPQVSDQQSGNERRTRMEDHDGRKMQQTAHGRRKVRSRRTSNILEDSMLRNPYAHAFLSRPAASRAVTDSRKSHAKNGPTHGAFSARRAGDRPVHGLFLNGRTR